MRRVVFPPARELRGLIRARLWAQILLAMVLGIVVGILLSPSVGGPMALSLPDAERLGGWLHLPGAVFLNLIQMVVVVLITSSIILGLTSAGDPKILAKVASRVVPYFLTTSTIAVLIGVVVAEVMQPGSYIDINSFSDAVNAQPAMDAAISEDVHPATLISEFIPSNISQAMLTQNMLQIVVIAVLAGVAISSVGISHAEPILRLAQSMQTIALKIVSWAMRLAPYAVFGLISEFVIQVGVSALLGLSLYILSVIIGLLILLFVYLLIVSYIAKRSPLSFLAKIADVQLLAFSTSSSAATMPMTMKTAEEKLEVRPAIAKFIVPLGATVNMDGTALYQVIAAMFIAQAYGVVLEPASFALLVFSVVGASIGSPSTPGVGIVILATILQSIGIPPSGVAILLGVDRILDMCRTAVNVTGDLVACSVMDKWLADDLTHDEDVSDDEPNTRLDVQI